MPRPMPPVILNPNAPQPGGPFEYMDETIIRDVSPSRSTTTTSMSSWDTSSYHHHHHHESPVELVHRSRSRSRSGREIRAEIRALERELVHRPRGKSTSGEVVRAERLSNGELVITEDRLEKVVEHRKPPRIEKDKKGPPPKLMRAMLATLT
ncbi:hypothetical protein FDECE_7326 [Fusarium decemcellulare]|nr:hypothetical protein FDECE_7326 [Fusarium decemcellulare]